MPSAIPQQAANRWAFKEWGIICAALAAGRQSVILRKGGIHEGTEGFQVQHREFWLFPTGYHQNEEELSEAGALWARSQNAPPRFPCVQHYVLIESVTRITEVTTLARLEPLHIWSPTTILERFHYRTPGLFALGVRVLELPQPIPLVDSPHFAGCRSWVDLPEDLSTAALRPVLDDKAHRHAQDQLQIALSGSISC